MKSLKSSVIGGIAFAAAGALFSSAASADASTRGAWDSAVSGWPTSVSESAPWKSADQPRQTDHGTHHAVGATGEVRGGTQVPHVTANRESPFPSSVNESAPWRLDR